MIMVGWCSKAPRPVAAHDARADDPTGSGAAYLVFTVWARTIRRTYLTSPAGLISAPSPA